MSRNKRITVLLDKKCPIDAGNPISHRSPYDIITLPRPIASRKSHRRLQQISRRNKTRLGNRFNFQILQRFKHCQHIESFEKRKPKLSFAFSDMMKMKKG